MLSRPKIIAVLTIILLIVLSGCADLGRLTGQAPPPPEDVPPPATPLPTEPPTPTPLPPTPTPIPTEEPVLPQKPPAQPDAVILAFNLTGGIAGFCDELTIEADGDYSLQSCSATEVLTGTLEPADLSSLQTWRDNLVDFDLTLEDNPGGPDNMIRALTFSGQGELAADERQQQVIFDWISGLMARLREQQRQANAPPTPTPEPQPAPTEPESAPVALCPEVQRPALLLVDPESPTGLIIQAVDNESSCSVELKHPPLGRVVAAGDNLYYAVFEPGSKTVAVWRTGAGGEPGPLEFTRAPMENPGPFDFVVAADGRRIAWAQTQIDLTVEPPLYRNSLWLAPLDGGEPVTGLDQVENDQFRFVQLVRFGDDQDLYYALQPDIGGPVFSGRYDTLYRLRAGNQPELLYACPPGENPVCLGGVGPAGELLPVVQPDQTGLQLLDRSGALLNTVAVPGQDYIERTAFSPNGAMAFVSATLTEGSEEQPPLPNPGYISVLAPPYTGSPQTILSNNSVGSLWGWVDDDRLAFGALDETGTPNTSVVTLQGQVREISPHVAVGVLR